MELGALKRDLERQVRGEVRFDAGSRAVYANDFSIYRHIPIGVVVPADAADVEATVAACRAHGAPLLSRGAGTGPSGQTVNAAVVMDFSKAMRGIVELDPEGRRARVEPGVTCDQLRDTAEEFELTYGPDPATHQYCTFGGMIGNNSCGTHSLMAGKTSDNVEELEVLTYDGLRMRVGATSHKELEAIVGAGGRRGEIYAGLLDIRDRYADLVRERFPDIPRRVSGYNLDELLPENGFNVARALVGTEGTCVTILEATVRLVPSPQHRVTVVLGYPDVFAAADHTPEILTHGPIGLEGMDSVLTKNMEAKGRLAKERERLPDGGAWLLAEFGADSREEALAQARAAHEALEAGGGPHLSSEVLEEPPDTLAVWTVRESAVGDSRLPGKVEMEGAWEDAAVHPDRLGAYLREFQDLLDSHGYQCTYYGHFSQGCVHTRIDFDFRSLEGMRKFRSFMESAADLVTEHGGSIAGEYGEGQGRAELLPRMFGPELVRGFEEFKAIWDPEAKMNPGKVVNPYKLDENLRFGPDHHPADPPTVFSFAEDGGSFAKANERCFGMGRCRVPGGATMCPSYQVTGEEKHSTRGRARILMEMLKGEVITDGWRSEEVHEALDLCLSCKGCKGDCPVQVDMATYKAEFLSHYYRRRLRPRSAYAMGLIPWWARLARHAPTLANTVGASALGKAAAGVAPERTPPRFARETFSKWLAGRNAPPADGRPTVALWPDTFTNHFHPEVGRAAVEVLEDAGFHVRVPESSFCCGRPLYDYGMLSLARRLLRGTLKALEPDIRAGHPVVVLEPSCASVFRDELPNMLPDEEGALRLADQTHGLAEVLEGWDPPRLERRALLHGHCHQKALAGLDHDRSLLDRMGLEVEQPESGCCGMAGAFGYEKGERYDVSVKVGEQDLLPRVRSADADTLVVTDGFSCREQIAQGADGRRAHHLAEVVAMGLTTR